MKKEIPPNDNKTKKKYNWEYHEKLNQKYESYLKDNIDKNNIRLKGNYHYENKPLNYYLNKKVSEPINNLNLTPIPQSKFLNIKTKEQNKKDYQKFQNIQKSVVEMRRMEYEIDLKQKIKKETINKKENEEKEAKNKIKNKRNTIKDLDNVYNLPNIKRRSMKNKEIIEYIFNNINDKDKLERKDIYT